MSVDAGDTSKTHRGHTLHINDLPVGVLHHVFDFLGPRDLCCVSVTCALWAALNKDAAASQVRSSSGKVPRLLSVFYLPVRYQMQITTACGSLQSCQAASHIPSLFMDLLRVAL